MDGQNSAPFPQCNKDLSMKIVDCIDAPREEQDAESEASKKCQIEVSNRLSALPVDVQLQILSSLSTIDAAKTVFVSKTGMAAWNSFPNLVFDLNMFPGKYSCLKEKFDTLERFINVTVAHHDKSDVHTFELWLLPDFYCPVSIPVSWIRFAVEHNVEKLVLFGKMARNTKILESLLSCESIVRLELAIEDYLLTWPKTCTLPNLRKLKLKFLVFDQDSHLDLFSGCPALEKLSICFCDVTSFKILLVTAPKLTEFVMCYCPGMADCSLKFPSANLSKFIYICHERSEIELIPTRVLGVVIHKADFILRSERYWYFTSSVVTLTREIFTAKSLEIDPSLIKLLSMAHDLPRRLEVDAFSNLRELTIGLRSKMKDIRITLCLISRCLFISKLYLELQGLAYGNADKTELNLDLSNYGSRKGFEKLIFINITNFVGNARELTLVRSLLAHAHQLGLMRIYKGRLLTHVQMICRVNAHEEILKYERASPVARVKFF